MHWMRLTIDQMVKKKIYIAVETTQNEAQAIKRLKT